MSLVLANITSLWKEISTNPMQRPLSSLSHSRAIVTWLLALLWSLLPTHLTAYHPHHISLWTPASIYLIFHSLSFQKGHSPQGTDHHLQCAVLPLCWFLQMQPTESTIISSWQGEGDLPQTCFQLSAESCEIRWPPQEPVWGWKGTAEIHHVHCSLPLFIIFVATLDAGKEIECINCFTWVYSAPLLSEAKSHGVSGGWRWVQH